MALVASETDHIDPATPTAERCITSYPARRKFRAPTQHPPACAGVTGAIDIHCHVHDGGNDPLSTAKFASESGMAGLVMKTIGKMGMINGTYDPAYYLRPVRDELHRWADDTGVKPVECFMGAVVGQDNEEPSVAKVKKLIDDGLAAIWLPVANNAHSLHKVGGKTTWWDKTAAPTDHSLPMQWPEALEKGYFLLDEKGKLAPVFQDIIKLVADEGIALFFGHTTHDEMFIVAELVEKLGYKRAVIDHPFSPFIDLTIAEMKHFTRAGIYLNFTYDELSPFLGVDPKRMYDAIRAVGVEHVTLSSDADGPLFPEPVEAMRLIRNYMAAFGLTQEELDITCSTNPLKVMGRA